MKLHDPVILVSGTEIRHALVCEVDGNLYKLDHDTPTKNYTWYTAECLFPDNEHNSKVVLELVRLSTAQDLIKTAIQGIKTGLVRE